MRKRLACSIGGEARGGLAFAGDVARADPGALDDPLIGRVDGLRQLVVGDSPPRQSAAGAQHNRMDAHCAASLAKAWARKLSRSSPILRMMSLRTIRAATPIALATPLALALPWLFTTRPLSPRKTAPLWLFGSRWTLSRLSAGRDSAKPAFERSELLKARRRRSVTKRAVPSAVLSAIFPEKPSVTTTSTPPRESWSPSVNPSNRNGR